jgi:hypothetical protein
MKTLIPDKPERPVCSHCGKPKPNLIPFGNLKLCQECLSKTMGTNGEEKL